MDTCVRVGVSMCLHVCMGTGIGSGMPKRMRTCVGTGMDMGMRLKHAVVQRAHLSSDTSFATAGQMAIASAPKEFSNARLNHFEQG